MPTQVHDLDRSDPEPAGPMERAQADRLRAETLDRSPSALILELQRMTLDAYAQARKSIAEEEQRRKEREAEAERRFAERQDHLLKQLQDLEQNESKRVTEQWKLLKDQQQTMVSELRGILDVAGSAVASSFENIARARETAEVLNKPRAPQPTAGESAVKCVQELVQGAVQIFSKNPALMEKFGGALAAMTGEADAEPNSPAGSGQSAPETPAERAVTLGDIAEANAMIQEFEKRLSSDQLTQLAKRLGKGELELSFAEVTAEIERLGAKTGTAS